jgi:ribulose-phosphate 3-epimerase
MLASNLADLRGELAGLENSGLRLVHWDVMDGHFVPNLTFGPPVIRLARQHSSLGFDVHLMVENPAEYVRPLSGCGVELLSFQIEATRYAPRLCGLIREQGMQPSIALNPQTPLDSLDYVLGLVDNVLIMTVDPGFGGQSFIEASWVKISALMQKRDQLGLKFTIQVDGGVCSANLPSLKQAGVDIAVAGTAWFGTDDKGRRDLLAQAEN